LNRSFTSILDKERLNCRLTYPCIQRYLAVIENENLRAGYEPEIRTSTFLAVIGV